MARRIGDEFRNQLFGTPDNDVILGRGGFDTISGGDGNDRISGHGSVEAGAGNDSWFSVKTFDLHRDGSNPATVDMGDGRDVVVHTAHDAAFNGYNGARPTIDMGGGNDRLVIGSTSSPFTSDLGTGADRAFVMSEFSIGLQLGGGNDGDGAKDIVHYGAPGATHEPDFFGPGLTLQEFGPEDVLVLYGTGLSRAELAQRTEFVFDSRDSWVRITLDDNTSVNVNKFWLGSLGPDNLRLVERDLARTEKVWIGDDDSLQRSVFLSGAEDTVNAKGRAVFAGAGDDVVNGGGRSDRLYGENGDDRLVGKAGKDKLFGGAGDDTLLGGRGNDEIHTGAGNDLVRGGGGKDLIVYGERLEGATDTSWNAQKTDGRLFGERGNDTFVFDTRTLSMGDEVRANGGGGRDRFELSSENFGDLIIDGFKLRQDSITITVDMDRRASDFGRAESAIATARDTDDRDGAFPAEGLVYDFGTLDIILTGLSTEDADRVRIEVVEV